MKGSFACCPEKTKIEIENNTFSLFVSQGASVIVYRSAELRRFQIYAYSQWPGGLFGSVGFSGTRPGKVECMNDQELFFKVNY